MVLGVVEFEVSDGCSDGRAPWMCATCQHF